MADLKPTNKKLKKGIKTGRTRWVLQEIETRAWHALVENLCPIGGEKTSAEKSQLFSNVRVQTRQWESEEVKWRCDKKKGRVQGHEIESISNKKEPMKRWLERRWIAPVNTRGHTQYNKFRTTQSQLLIPFPGNRLTFLSVSRVSMEELTLPEQVCNSVCFHVLSGLVHPRHRA